MKGQLKGLLSIWVDWDGPDASGECQGLGSGPGLCGKFQRLDCFQRYGLFHLGVQGPHSMIVIIANV